MSEQLVLHFRATSYDLLQARITPLPHWPAMTRMKDSFALIQQAVGLSNGRLALDPWPR
jgi:hypothetical protein